MMKKNRISALVFLAFLASLFAFPLLVTSNNAPSIIANSEDDDVDGIIESRNFNNRASIGQFQLLESDGTTAISNNAQIDPQTTYRVKLTLNDPDTIRDLESLEVRFFNSSVSGTGVTPGQLTVDFDSATTTGDDGQEFVVKWTTTGDNVQDDFQIVESNSNHTWSLTSVSTPQSNQLNNTSFTFEFDFEVSKVAPYYQDAGVAWYFGAVIDDGRISLEDGSDEKINQESISLSALTASAVAGNAYDVNGASYWRVNWYGEISIADTSVNWSNLPAGVTFGAVSANASIGGIQLIANGQYDTQIRSKQAHWNAIMTADLAEVVFENFTTTDFGNFRREYNLSAAALKQAPYNFDIPDNLNDISTNDTPSALATLPYEVINIVADLVGSGAWQNFEYNLQAPLEGVNTTGATMITSSAAFSELLGTTETNMNEFQAFAIGFITYGAISESGVKVTVDGTDYYLVASSGSYNDNSVPFHSFGDEEGDISKAKTDEAGDSSHLDLYIALSRIYQNARYEGVLQLKITDPLN